MKKIIIFGGYGNTGKYLIDYLYDNIDTNTLKTLINSYNILVNESHPLYLYLPIELNYNVNK